MPKLVGTQEEIFNALVENVFNDFDESRLDINAVKKALSENFDSLKSFSFQLLCQLAAYFEACCPVEWNSFMASLSNSQLKEKLLEEQRLRTLAQDAFYNAIVCGLGADDLGEIEHFVYVSLYLQALDVYTGFYANELKTDGLGADFQRPLFSLALQTRYQDEDNKKFADATKVIIKYSDDTNGWGKGELLCSLAGIDSNILYFSRENYPKLAFRAVKKVVIDAKAAIAVEAKFEDWRVNANKDPHKKLVDYLVDLPDPHNSIVLDLIKCNSDKSKYLEAQTKIKEKELQQEEALRQNIKLAIAGAVIGVVLVVAVASAIFFTGGTILALAPLLFTVGSAISAGLFGAGLAVGAKKTWDLLKEKFLKQKSQTSAADLSQESPEVSALVPDDASVANEEVGAATPVAGLRESIVPTLQVAVLSGVIEKLAEKAPDIATAANGIESRCDENDSDTESMADLTSDNNSNQSSLDGFEEGNFRDATLFLYTPADKGFASREHGEAIGRSISTEY